MRGLDNKLFRFCLAHDFDLMFLGLKWFPLSIEKVARTIIAKLLLIEVTYISH